MHAMMAHALGDPRAIYCTHRVGRLSCASGYGSRALPRGSTGLQTSPVVFCPSHWHAPALPLLSWHAAGCTAGKQTHAAQHYRLSETVNHLKLMREPSGQPTALLLQMLEGIQCPTPPLAVCTATPNCSTLAHAPNVGMQDSVQICHQVLHEVVQHTL
jgi:hypothetical protein